MQRLLLLMPATTYRATDFLTAAERIGVEVTVGTNGQQALEAVVPGGTFTLDFLDVPRCIETVTRFAKTRPFQAVVASDEETVTLAAQICEALSLPHNPVSAVAAAKDKHRLRETLTANAVLTPSFQIFHINDPPEEVARKVPFPCVLKPTFLSASRGVIRADDPCTLKTAFERLSALLKDPEVRNQGQAAAQKILVESFIPGREVALEGLLQNGDLTVLAIFDKPDPLDGPFFEETIYVTPSRLSATAQREVADCIQRATWALGLKEGPIHAELRINRQGIWVIEVAPRSIGGICSRTLRFGVGLSLEEIILRHAFNLPIASLKRHSLASGVMMIPIPKKGVLDDYTGVAEAKRVHHIEAVTITMRRRQKVIPLPEGRQYLGFIFARAEDPETVESALREAHQKLSFTIAPI